MTVEQLDLLIGSVSTMLACTVLFGVFVYSIKNRRV